MTAGTRSLSPPRLPPYRTVAASGLLCLIAAVTLTLSPTRVHAFFPTNLRTGGSLLGHSHERITTDALEALDAEFFGVQSPSGSMRAANEAIVDGNIHVDDDQIHSALHFDGENFVAGQGRILGLKEIVIESIQQNDAQGAREELGQALHSIQDFYAHSNWTNNNSSLNPDLGVDGHQLQNTLGINNPAEVNFVLTTALTSGYYRGGTVCRRCFRRSQGPARRPLRQPVPPGLRVRPEPRQQRSPIFAPVIPARSGGEPGR